MFTILDVVYQPMLLSRKTRDYRITFTPPRFIAPRAGRCAPRR